MGETKQGRVDAKGLRDRELIEGLRNLVGGEQSKRAELIAHIMEFDRRMLYAEEGHSSLFDYCVRALGYSEPEAAWRVYTARAAQTFPYILDLLEARRIHMTAVVLLAPHLTEENHRRLLEEASGKTRRELEEMIANMSFDGNLAAAARAMNGVARQMIRPMPGGRVRFSFVGDLELLREVERSREILRHKFPAGRLREVFGEGIDELLDRRDPDRVMARQEKRRARAAPAASAAAGDGEGAAAAASQDKACEPPEDAVEGGARASRGALGDERRRGDATASRRVPQEVKRAVWRRDGGRCAWVKKDGERCGKRDWLEYDHVVPWARGGRSDDPGNIRLLCRTHNRLMALKAFGALGPRTRREGT